jgi:hypothetical protein
LLLRRIFGPKRDEVTGEWRKMHSGELHNLYSSPDIVRQIKSRGMRWAGHVARMGEGRNVYRVLVGKPKERVHSEDRGVDGRMGLGWILRRLAGGGNFVGLIHLAQNRDRWFCRELGDESSVNGCHGVSSLVLRTCAV